MANWYVYIIRCGDGTLYTGITTDVGRRVSEHEQAGPRAARYLRGRGPLQLVFACDAGDRGRALQLEYRIKHLSRTRKEALIEHPETVIKLQVS